MVKPRCKNVREEQVEFSVYGPAGVSPPLYIITLFATAEKKPK